MYKVFIVIPSDLILCASENPDDSRLCPWTGRSAHLRRSKSASIMTTCEIVKSDVADAIQSGQSSSQGYKQLKYKTGYTIYLPPRATTYTFTMQKYLALTLTLTAGAYAALESCPSDLPLSCQNTTTVSSSDSCCFNAPGGALLLTQFWDTDPVTGPVDSWTIHGLWYIPFHQSH